MVLGRIVIREATAKDTPLVFALIRDLAAYERLSDQITATEESIRHWIFDQHAAEVLIGEIDGEPAGYALYFRTFSTFGGKAGMYVEDVYVTEPLRKQGLGKAFFIRMAQICQQRGYGRMEWNCLDWNAPSISFYTSMGAVPLSDWTMFRLSRDAVAKLANEKTVEGCQTQPY
jgi:GNAT superfamily N-acetyltransferase